MTVAGKTRRHGSRGGHDRLDPCTSDAKTARVDQIAEHHLGAEPLERDFVTFGTNETPNLLTLVAQDPHDSTAQRASASDDENHGHRIPRALRPRATRISSIGVPGSAVNQTPSAVA
jgi:hypothetical protein